HGTSYVTPKTDELLALVNESFNPYQDSVTPDQVDHMIVDNNGRLFSSNGTVRDKNAGSVVNKPKPTPTPDVSPTPAVSEPVTSAPPTETPPATLSPLPSDTPVESEPPVVTPTPDAPPIPTPPEGVPT
ncbi:MAG: transcriptional regulator, partial [Oscillospiraceae bacterium]